MSNGIISACLKNRFLTILGSVVILLWGIWALLRTPVDAIPGLSDNQIIVYTMWEGRSPQIIEDQDTYPLATNLQGLPHVRAVRSTTMFGASMIYVIFEDKVDLYWARSRVLERLNQLGDRMPKGVTPVLGPDGTGVGHVYWDHLKRDRHDLGESRAIQDWALRSPLQAVSGVAEVASIGGFVKQYQVDLDPVKLLAYRVPVKAVTQAVSMANREVGGNVIEENAMEYQVRGRVYLRSKEDVENIVGGTALSGTPIYVKNLGVVQMGGASRRGLLDVNGEGEVAGGIIVMRYGENAQKVIERVKVKLAELAPGLPPGVTVETAYDRSDLIQKAFDTLKAALIEEVILVTLAHIIFLWHFRSILIVTSPLPLAILVSFIFMHYVGLNSNIMSLGGIAIAIGVLVDAGIVMTENVIRHAEQYGEGYEKNILSITEKSAHLVGRPIFYAMAIIILAFVPVFALPGLEGKMFHPLAFTKTFAMVGSTFIAVTLVPVLCSFLVRGKLHKEEANWRMKYLMKAYKPALNWALDNRKKTVAIAAALFSIAIVMVTRIGREFMPPLNEGSLLFMPVTLPNISINEAKRLITIQDKIIKETPEVEHVLGKVGRAETSTDPSPVSMFETIILLKPKDKWRKGMTQEKLIGELNARLQIPGVGNGWTMPIINRINMLSTGVRTDLGVKIYGDDLNQLSDLAVTAGEVLKNVPGAVDVVAERTLGGAYLDIVPDRGAAARGGAPRGGGGGQITLGQVAKISVSPGPAMISAENSFLRSVVFLNVRGRDMGRFVDEAKEYLAKNLKLPPGYFVEWSGQYENQIRAKKTLRVVVPMVFLIIFVMLVMVYHSVKEALNVILAGLLPIFWSTRTGSEVMKPLATPVLGGMVSSLLFVLVVTPVTFLWLRERELKKAYAAGTGSGVTGNG